MGWGRSTGRFLFKGRQLVRKWRGGRLEQTVILVAALALEVGLILAFVFMGDVEGLEHRFSWQQLAILSAILFFIYVGYVELRVKRYARIIETSESFYHSLVENLPQNMARKDLEGRITFANNRFCALIGKKLEDLVGKTDLDLFPPHLARKYQDDDRQVLATGRVYDAVEEHRLPSGETLYVHVIKTPLYDVRQQLIGLQVIFWDVTREREAELALQKSEERYALAVMGAKDGLWDWDVKAGQVYYSLRWKSMLGYDDVEIGASPEEWFKRVHPDDLSRTKGDLDAHLAGRSPHFESEHRMLCKDGVYRWMLSRGIAVRGDAGQAVRMAGSQTDVTDRKRAEEKLAHQAFYDPLTNLPNRQLFIDRLSQTLRRARRQRSKAFGVLFLDLDRFKQVNDGLGHANGDKLLVDFARRLESSVRPGDTVARLGGDEFTVLLEDIRGINDAVYVAERIQKEFKVPFNLGGQEVFVTVSIGIAHGVSYEKPDDLLRDADTAMYRAKERGRACYEVFDQGMHSRVIERLRLETDLRRALERQEFRVYYQAIASLADERIIGFEALVRWQHPQRGLLAPAEFLPLAEETGLILPIDLCVLREACRQTRAWHERFPSSPPLRINVNLSTKHFGQGELVADVELILKETGLDARALTLEITESVLLEDVKTVLDRLQQLKLLNIQLYLDDFGTGYSSLSYLHRFPIDSLKIHHSFVGQLGTKSDQAQLVRTITTLARNLNMGVVAEGVETPEQLQQLRELNCERVQGYLISKPVPAEAAEALIASRREVAPL